MLSRLVASIGVVALSALPKVRQEPSAAQAPTGGAISGSVSRVDTGKPIVGAVIQIVPAVGRSGWSTTKSDDQGHYQFKNLAAAQYALQVTASGFAPASRFVMAARPAADGQFRVDGRLPGGYLAVAVPAIPIPLGGGTPDPSWLTFMTPLASSFRISGTESVTLSLKLVKP